MRFLICLAFAMCGVIVESNQALADLIVHSGPFFRNSHTYYLLEAGSWTESEATAVSLGGHLATINDAAENQWILDTIPAPPGTGGYLIGFTDTAIEGTFVWTSGEAVAYTNWGSGEPSNSGGSFGDGEDYTMLRSGGTAAGEWNDISDFPGNQGDLRGVVEINAVVPEPSSLALLGIGAIGMAIGAARRRRQKKQAESA